MEQALTPEQLKAKILSKENLNDLATLFVSIKDSAEIIYNFIQLGKKYTDELKQENLKLYNDRVRPLLIIVDNVEEELKDPNLSEELKQSKYVTLFQASKDIFESGKDFGDSNKRDFANFLKGVVYGGGVVAIAGLALTQVYNFVKKIK